MSGWRRGNLLFKGLCSFSVGGLAAKSIARGPLQRQIGGLKYLAGWLQHRGFARGVSRVRGRAEPQVLGWDRSVHRLAEGESQFSEPIDVDCSKNNWRKGLQERVRDDWEEESNALVAKKRVRGKHKVQQESGDAGTIGCYPAPFPSANV